MPVGAYEAVTKAMREALKPGAIVSDVGSVKGAVVAQVQPHLPPGVHFVPAHPVAGTEHSGPDAGFATLFHNRWCILTPPDGTDEQAVEKVREFWAAMGSNVEVMTAAAPRPRARDHEPRAAPHRLQHRRHGSRPRGRHASREVIKFSAGGFRDFTRIAASDPTMWRDVFLNNKEAVLEMLGRFNEDLASLQRAIRWGDGEALFDLFTRTRAIRRGIISVGQETPEPDFGRRREE